jgi:hypothetical protein
MSTTDARADASTDSDGGESFAAELDAVFLPPTPLSPAGAAARDHALHIDLVINLILEYLPPPAQAAAARVSRAWASVAEGRSRRAARLLLAPLLGMPTARLVEAAVFAEAGAGPGAANAAVRRLASNLARNADLRARVASGALAPAALVRMTPLELATPRDRDYVASVTEAALAAASAASRGSLAVHVRGRHECECGSREQHRRVVLRPGTTDVSRASETLVCVRCRAEVGPWRV